MHEATVAGSERIGHNTSGGIAIVTCSRIEIMMSGYRQSLASADVDCAQADSAGGQEAKVTEAWSSIAKLLIVLRGSRSIGRPCGG